MTPRVHSFIRHYPDAVEYWIAARLERPDKALRGRWGKSNSTKQWAARLTSAVGRRPTEWSLITGQHWTKGGAKVGPQLKPTYRMERRAVAIEIHVPSRRNFIKDDDNLAFSRKPLLDALKRVGLICDDARTWTDSGSPTQHVSDDRRFWTIIRISRAPAAQRAA